MSDDVKRTAWGEVECPSCGNPASVPRVIFGKGIGANAAWEGTDAHPCLDSCHEPQPTSPDTSVDREGNDA